MSDPAPNPTPIPPPAPPPGPTVAPPAPAPQPAPTEPATFSVEYVRELRSENKGTRLKLAETEQQKQAALKAVDDAKADADAKIKAATEAANQRIIRAELKAAALKAGMHDLDGLKLADLSKVTLNDKGEIEGAEALMDELKKAKPYLFTTTTTSNPQDPPPPKGGNDPKKVKDMTPQEYAAARAALGRKAR